MHLEHKLLRPADFLHDTSLPVEALNRHAGLAVIENIIGRSTHVSDIDGALTTGTTAGGAIRAAYRPHELRNALRPTRYSKPSVKHCRPIPYRRVAPVMFHEFPAGEYALGR